MTKLYKVLDTDLRSMHGGEAQWVLGEWQPAVSDPVLCERGYHLCRPADLVHWLGPVIAEAEARGTRIDGDDKIVVAEPCIVRVVPTWNERTARLFAADCAEHVVHLAGPAKAVCRATIAVVRRYADGAATREELAAAWSAAGDAAGAAAGDAAGDAAGAAAWSAAGDAAGDAARAAAGAAARAAAGAAARDAAWAAAGDAERQWQTARLMAYLDEEVQGE